MEDRAGLGNRGKYNHVGNEPFSLELHSLLIEGIVRPYEKWKSGREFAKNAEHGAERLAAFLAYLSLLIRQEAD